MTHDVFISHSHKDKKIADAICHHYEQEKIKCWIAPRDITPGVNWAEAISDAIPQCKIMLLIFSSHANMSHQVLREVELAVKNRLIIVPVKIEDINPTKGMEYYLSTVHWIDVVNKKTEKYIESLTQTVKGYLNSEKITPPPLKQNDLSPKKKIPLAVWISAAAFVVILGVLGIVFRNSLFNQNPEDTTIPNTESTASQESINISVQTPTITLTDSLIEDSDLNITNDTIVEIEDTVLRDGIIKTLAQHGVRITSDITVSDMLKLEYLKIASTENYESMADLETSNTDYASFFSDNVIVTDEDIYNIDCLKYAKNLKMLYIAGKSIRDISAIENLTDLEYLSLANNEISSIEALKNLPKIKRLVLDDNLIIDLSPLQNLSTLLEILVSGNLIEDIEPLISLPYLEALGINDNPIKDLSFIAELRYLDGINLSYYNLEDLSILSNMRKATWLVLQDCNINDISPLSNLRDLELLFIIENDIDDLSPITKLWKLKKVWISEYTAQECADSVSDLINNGVEVYKIHERIEE